MDRAGKKKWRWVRCVLLLTALLIFAAYVRGVLAGRSMLRHAGLGDYQDLRRIDYSRSIGRDPQRCADGFEISAFSVKDGARFIPPADWTIEEAVVDVADVARRCGASVDVGEIVALSLGGFECGAWFFEGGEGQDFYLAYCYDSYGQDLIFIYRGHWSG